MTANLLDSHKVVTEEEWLTARRDLLQQEQELVRQRDRVRAARSALPWVKLGKEYIFDTPAGKKTLAGLFEGRSQLIVYHFMWKHDFGTACPGCALLADHIDGANPHLANHDVTFVAVSRAPLDLLEAYKRCMGWRFPWVSSLANDFNFDYHVSFTPEQLASGEVYYNYAMMQSPIDELPGVSVFYNQIGEVFHTYSSYGRDNEELLAAYMYLDLTPKGRDETAPHHNLVDWLASPASAPDKRLSAWAGDSSNR